ncbi:MAG: hypothetical protein JWO29_1169 [Arthrobacter sp.]|nr:hypothetical protein [Arthrobacter sp.]
MTLYQPEPVEISTRMRPGEWTEESLAALVASYRDELLGMGASASEIEIVTDRDGSGGVNVAATWIKKATATGETTPGNGAG